MQSEINPAAALDSVALVFVVACLAKSMEASYE